MRTFRKYLGGAAGNMAVALARLGARVGLISRVGDDAHGRFLLRYLQQEGVDTTMVRTDPQYPTGLAFAEIHPPDRYRVLFYRKPCADIQVEVTDLDEDLLRGAELLVVAGTALSQPPSREATLWALARRRDAGGRNVLDVDWRPQFWHSEEEGRRLCDMAMGLCDVVIANEPELAFAGGSDEPATAAARILSLGPAQVIAKRGAAGAIGYSTVGERVVVLGMPVTALNTLGCGDAFSAAYCWGLLQGWDLSRCLRFANASGALVATRHACSAAMPYQNEIEALLAVGPKALQKE